MTTPTNDQAETTTDEPFNRLPPEKPERQEREAAVEAYRDITVEEAKPPLRIKLEPPVDYDGTSYKEIICDFDQLIGKDFIIVQRDFKRLYKPADKNDMPLPEMCHEYHDLLIQRAAKVAGCDVPLGLIFKLPRRFYIPLRTEALKACGSSPEEEKA